MKPVIGILYCGFLTQGFDRQSIYVTASYLSAIETSGGLPVIIPCISSTYDIASYIKLCDGFLFCGEMISLPSYFVKNFIPTVDTPIRKQIPFIYPL